MTFPGASVEYIRPSSSEGDDTKPKKPRPYIVRVSDLVKGEDGTTKLRIKFHAMSSAADRKL